MSINQNIFGVYKLLKVGYLTAEKSILKREGRHASKFCCHISEQLLLCSSYVHKQKVISIAPDKREYPDNIFLISPRKLMLWVGTRLEQFSKAFVMTIHVFVQK